jgi:hypothetical protein
MKVVVNRCYGGFGLSQKAVELYFELQGWKLVTVHAGSIDCHYKTDKNTTWYDGNLDRDDPLLIQVVETLDDEANGQFAKLEVVEIPDGIAWTITEYDGYESVEEEHRSW